METVDNPLITSARRSEGDVLSYDPAGALTISGALVLLVYAVVEAPDVGWGDVRTILLVAGRRCSSLPSRRSSRATARRSCRSASSARARSSVPTR